jgi:hypothetical protein
MYYLSQAHYRLIGGEDAVDGFDDDGDAEFEREGTRRLGEAFRGSR